MRRTGILKQIWRDCRRAIHQRLFRLNRWASILLTRRLIKGTLGSKDLLGVCQIIAGLVLQWFRSVSIKFSCVTQVAIASSNKFCALNVRGNLAIGAMNLTRVINFYLKVDLTFKATLVDLITYLVSKVSSLTTRSPKTYRNLTHSIRRIQDHCLWLLSWCSLVIRVARPISVGCDIQNLNIRFINGASIVHWSLQWLKSSLLALDILPFMSIWCCRKVAQVTQVRLRLIH